jgi:hypothetical protein
MSSSSQKPQLFFYHPIWVKLWSKSANLFPVLEHVQIHELWRMHLSHLAFNGWTCHVNIEQGLEDMWTAALPHSEEYFRPWQYTIISRPPGSSRVNDALSPMRTCFFLFILGQANSSFLNHTSSALPLFVRHACSSYRPPGSLSLGVAESH